MARRSTIEFIDRVPIAKRSCGKLWKRKVTIGSNMVFIILVYLLKYSFFYKEKMFWPDSAWHSKYLFLNSQQDTIYSWNWTVYNTCLYSWIIHSSVKQYHLYQSPNTFLQYPSSLAIHKQGYDASHVRLNFLKCDITKET